MIKKLRGEYDMTSRERVFTALAHKQPDRCPVDLLLEPTTCNTLMQHFHVNSQQELYDIFEADNNTFTCTGTSSPIFIHFGKKILFLIKNDLL